MAIHADTKAAANADADADADCQNCRLPIDC